MTATEEFVEFATAAAPRLRRTAFLLCGDWHTAEDLAQTTLTKMFVSWWRVKRREAVFAYASRTLVNTYIADKRGRRSSEVITDVLPESATPPDTPETRMVVLAALATLSPRARTVVVMRFWADMSVEQVADVLGCSSGTVKSLSSRAMDKMRAVLEDSDGSFSSLSDQERRRHG
ncbi:MAG TPA: SigE family RNA polymerase sigma factor [Streptosporangiaceae bacterium]